MSRTPTEYTIPPPPPGLVLNPVANLRGRAAAVEWIRDKLGVEVSERYLLDATTRREVELGSKVDINWHSERREPREMTVRSVRIGPFSPNCPNVRLGAVRFETAHERRVHRIEVATRTNGHSDKCLRAREGRPIRESDAE